MVRGSVYGLEVKVRGSASCYYIDSLYILTILISKKHINVTSFSVRYLLTQIYKGCYYKSYREWSQFNESNLIPVFFLWLGIGFMNNTYCNRKELPYCNNTTVIEKNNPTVIILGQP